MKLLRSLFLTALSLGAVASLASAAAQPFKIDQSHTVVGFSVRHFFGKVPGRFNDFAGTLNLDEKDLTQSSVDVTIQSKSIFTNNERRDNHLRSGDFFAADSFPTLTFKSTKITKDGDKYKVAGDLTMRGVTKPVVLDASLLGIGKVDVEGHDSGYRANFEATTTVNRKDFGINWNRTLDQGGTLLGDDVTINLEVEAVKQAAENGKAATNAKVDPEEGSAKKK